MNFAKNLAALSLINKSAADFIVNVDADIEIKQMDKKLSDAINTSCNYVMQAPEDRFKFGWFRWSKINAGFIVWRNCQRAADINSHWLNKAMNECHVSSCNHEAQSCTAKRRSSS